jgi:hypothetical protein
MVPLIVKQPVPWVAQRMAFLLILSILLAMPLDGQDQLLPVDIQVPLFLKVMSFDRHLKTWTGDTIIVGVIYQGKVRESADFKDEFLQELGRSAIKDIGGTAVRCVPVDIDTGQPFAEAIKQSNVNILYVAPLRSASIQSITEVSRNQHLPTFTGVPDYVESGLAVGVIPNGRKSLIIINMPATRAEGIDFSTQFLRMAKVIQ